MRAPAVPRVNGHWPLLTAFIIDALGTGLFLPFSVLLFLATTTMTLPAIGMALGCGALIRIPATAMSGVLLDRVGAKTCVVVSNVLQAVGCIGYLFVTSFGELVAAAAIVQVGNSLFWVSYAALISDVSAPGEQERWFGVVNGLRAAGLGLGALLASAAVAGAGVTGYRMIVLLNAISYMAAALFLRFDPAKASRPSSAVMVRGRWTSVIEDRPFLAFVGASAGLTYLSLAFAVAVPVYLVHVLHLPAWAPGSLMALNAVGGALLAVPIVGVITGHRRSRVLTTSQLSVATAYFCLLAMSGRSPWLVAALGVAAAVLVTAAELVQGPVVSTVINESATDHDRGRYIATYQMTFSVVDVIAPPVLTWTLARGPLTTWGPLVVLALLDAVALGVLSRRLPSLRRRVGAES